MKRGEMRPPILLAATPTTLALSFENLWDRRSSLESIAASVISYPSASLAATSAIDSSNLSLRFDSDFLKQPPVRMGSELDGIDNTYFPDFLEGTWQCTQTLVNVEAPLGTAYLGGPNGSVSIGENTLDESRSRLNLPVSFHLRFVNTKFGVAEDRRFNLAQRLDAFAGKKVVASVDYADVGGSNRASLLALGGTQDDPLQTTLVYYKGPAAEKTFVTGHSNKSNPVLSETGERIRWTGYETQRSIFALTNASTAPPITTDRELLSSFEVDTSAKDDPKRHVQGKLRIASYLNPTDRLYFDSRNRAVSIQDYTLQLDRIVDQ